jgi:rifampicin phosphotransferase
LELRRSLPAQERLIIRSSAIGEDGVGASFAGQLDSIANVQTNSEIEHALMECWASYWNERVLFYQRARNVRLLGMGVVIQLQVASRLSGVLFTRPPGHQAADDQMLLEYCGGFGGALVSGQINPGRVRIWKSDCRYSVDRAPEQSEEQLEERLLFNDKQIAGLVRTAARLEAHFEAPQDIEWTIDSDGGLFFVQSRPITVAAATAPGILWSNANVTENFPDPITPFLYSIAAEGYYHYFRNLAVAFGISPARVSAMEYSFRHIIGVHYARMYYNLTSIHSVLRLAPFGDRLAEFFNDFVGAAAMAPSSPEEKTDGWRQYVEALNITLKTTWQYLFLTKRVAEFESRCDRFAIATHPDGLGRRSLLELRDDLRRFMEIRCHHWTNASLADAAAMVCYGVLRLLLRKAYPAESDSAIHNNLLKGLGVVSAGPTIKLWELSRKIQQQPELTRWFTASEPAAILPEIQSRPDLSWLRNDFQAYLDQWGFRFSGELMLTVPSFQENPLPLVELLQSYLKAEGPSPLDAIGRLELQRFSETERVLEDFRRNKRLRRLPRLMQSPLIRAVLNSAHRAILLRERARTKQALLYSRCRRIVLAIGEQLTKRGTLQEAADVFFLTYAELDEFLSGHAFLPDYAGELVALRKRAHHVVTSISAPDTFTCPEGEYSPQTSTIASPEQPGNGILSGNGACGGQVVSRAAVLTSMTEAHMLQQGDILVTRQTDPGWAPVFFLIRGLVIERGGMLSHGAIIAREFGLPCVVGVANATSRIPKRCLLSVDGDRGHVRILD